MSGEIPAERMELFLELRAVLVTVCEEYGGVREGFDSVASLDSMSAPKAQDVGDTVSLLGGAALSITPFLARFFEARNAALLDANMSMEEYAYIYAVSYHDHLLSPETRNEIFSDGQALSPETSQMLKECMARQLEALRLVDVEGAQGQAVEMELQRMDTDPSWLVWQDGLPASIGASLTPYRERLDHLFCGAAAGLEMERSARRALRTALE